MHETGHEGYENYVNVCKFFQKVKVFSDQLRALKVNIIKAILFKVSNNILNASFSSNLSF